MKIYETSRSRADLLIAKVSSQVRLRQSDLRSDVVAVIEIKNQSYYRSYSHEAFRALVLADFEKLSRLAPQVRSDGVAKFMILMHENPKESAKFTDLLKSDLEQLKSVGIELLIPGIKMP